MNCWKRKYLPTSDYKLLHIDNLMKTMSWKFQFIKSLFRCIDVHTKASSISYTFRVIEDGRGYTVCRRYLKFWTSIVPAPFSTADHNQALWLFFHLKQYKDFLSFPTHKDENLSSLLFLFHFFFAEVSYLAEAIFLEDSMRLWEKTVLTPRSIPLDRAQDCSLYRWCNV